MNYFQTLPTQTKEYFKILSKEVPEFLEEYIETPEMKKLDGVNQICGGYWRKENIFDDMYSVLRHSVGVALIIWNFTHDKKQTIAGLFHDIASPAFKHCLDFLNGDVLNQESTEDKTLEIIKNSEEIMKLLKKDNIRLEEICDYKIYPIADNDTPMLSADRLEYTFMNGIYYKKVWNLNQIEKIYSDIYVTNNEYGNIELGFKSIEVAEQFIDGASELWPLWINSEDTVTMYFFADMIKKMYDKKLLTKDDLYNYPEKKIFGLIKNCEDQTISGPFKKFMQCKDFVECNEFKEDKFCVDMSVKRRYINPIVNNQRVYDVSNVAKNKIDNYLNLNIGKYAYINM